MRRLTIEQRALKLHQEMTRRLWHSDFDDSMERFVDHACEHWSDCSCAHFLSPQSDDSPHAASSGNSGRGGIPAAIPSTPTSGFSLPASRAVSDRNYRSSTVNDVDTAGHFGVDQGQPGIGSGLS
jgi:hypothetical protein